MRSYDLECEASFADGRHTENVLLTQDGGDFSVACWEPGQVSPYHCHPEATEAYFCVTGGGTMRTPSASVVLKPGSLVVHPLGELHEFENGRLRSILFRVRYGEDVVGFEFAWRGDPSWRQQDRDAEYFSLNPPPGDIAPS
jgi:mannose-6-phosphate isomerase-like protein (cupin superfamily)